MYLQYMLTQNMKYNLYLQLLFHVKYAYLNKIIDKIVIDFKIHFNNNHCTTISKRCKVELNFYTMQMFIITHKKKEKSSIVKLFVRMQKNYYHSTLIYITLKFIWL